MGAADRLPRRFNFGQSTLPKTTVVYLSAAFPADKTRGFVFIWYPMIPWVNRILSSSDHHLDGPSHDLVCFHSKSVEGVMRYSRV